MMKLVHLSSNKTPSRLGALSLSYDVFFMYTSLELKQRTPRLIEREGDLTTNYTQNH